MENLLTVLNVDCFSRTKIWSRPELLKNFTSVYNNHFFDYYKCSHKSGIVELYSDRYLCWELVSGDECGGTFLCLYDVDFRCDLIDNRICIRLGMESSEVISLFAESSAEENGYRSANISLLLSNGCVYSMELFIKSPHISLFQHFVFAKDGI